MMVMMMPALTQPPRPAPPSFFFSLLLVITISLPGGYSHCTCQRPPIDGDVWGKYTLPSRLSIAPGMITMMMRMMVMSILTSVSLLPALSIHILLTSHLHLLPSL